MRYGSIEATQDYADDKYFWPNVTCQKLLYNENAVVNSVLDTTKNLQFGNNLYLYIYLLKSIQKLNESFARRFFLP